VIRDWRLVTSFRKQVCRCVQEQAESLKAGGAVLVAQASACEILTSATSGENQKAIQKANSKGKFKSTQAEACAT